MDDIFIRCTKLPYKIYATTVYDSNGDYNVYINSEICSAKQEASLKHEICHIQENHFSDEKSLKEDEERADSVSFPKLKRG